MVEFKIFLILLSIIKKNSENEKHQTMNFIIYYSFSSTFSKISKLLISCGLTEILLGSPHLKKIHERFLKITDLIPISIITFVETNATIVTAMKFNFLLVERHSGDTGVGEYFEVPQDHLSICKPLSR